MAPTPKYQVEIVDGKKKYICPVCAKRLGSCQACYTHVKQQHKTENVETPIQENVVITPDTTPLQEVVATIPKQKQSVSRKEFDELKAQNQIIIQQNQTIIEMLKNLTNPNIVQVAKEDKTKKPSKDDKLDKEVALLREENFPIQVPTDAGDKSKTITERYEVARDKYYSHPYCVVAEHEGDKIATWVCPTCKTDYKQPGYLRLHLQRPRTKCNNHGLTGFIEVVDRYRYYELEYKKLNGKEEVKAETEEVEEQNQVVVEEQVNDIPEDVVDVSPELDSDIEEVVDDVSQDEQEQELVSIMVHDIIKNVIDNVEDMPEDDLSEEQVVQVKQVVDELLQFIENWADVALSLKEYISTQLHQEENDAKEVVQVDVIDKAEEQVYDISQEPCVIGDDDEKEDFDKFLLDCCRTIHDGGFARAFHYLIDSSKWHIKPDYKSLQHKEEVYKLIPKKDKHGNDVVDKNGDIVYETTKDGKDFKYKKVKETKVEIIKNFKVFDVKRQAKKMPCKHCTKGNLCEKCLYEPISLYDIRDSDEMHYVFSTLCKLWDDYKSSYNFDISDLDLFKNWLGGDLESCKWLDQNVSTTFVDNENIEQFFATIL